MMETFIRNFSEAAHKSEIHNLEFYVESTKTASAEVYQGKLQSNQISHVTACYVKGEYKGFAGFVSVEDFSRELFAEELECIRQTAELSKKPAVSLKIKNVGDDALQELANPEMMAQEMIEKESKVSKQYANLKKFGHFVCQEQLRTISIMDDQGNCMKDSNRYAMMAVRPEAEADGVIQTSGNECYAETIKQIDMEAVLSESAKETCEMLGAQPVQTGRYPVVLKNKIICEMLSMYLSAFGADNIHKSLSKLAGKKDEKIASEIVNLVEEPLLAGGVNNRSFDDEGTTTSRKEIVASGVLKMYLYNIEEAKKDQCQSTGNGFKLSYKGEPGIYVSNLKLLGEDRTRDTLIREMKNGLYITECDGMFAGANVVSGDFSLISKGYLVENGEIKRGINQITVAGNFFEMLKAIDGIANDERVSLTDKGAYIAPSVRVKELVVSGL